jgi:hypothetical protein
MADWSPAVAKFIAAEMEKPFAFASTDCCATADRWAAAVLGFSPLRRYGRDYANDSGAQEWLGEPGSIAVAVNRVMRASGLRKTADPQPGDIGLIVRNRKLCLAIHTGTMWFSRDANGFIGAPLTAVWKAWKIVP